MPSIRSLIWAAMIASQLIYSTTAFAMQPYIRLGSMELPPYGWKTATGERCGIVYQLNEVIAQRYGARYTNEIIPFARQYQMLRSKQIDLISSQPHEDAIAAGEKLAVIHTNNIIAVAKRDSGIHSFADLNGKAVLYHSGASYPKLDKIVGSIHFVPNYQTSLNMLFKAKGVDAAVFSEPAYYYWLNKLGHNPNAFSAPLLVESSRPQWIFVNRQLPDPVKTKLRSVIQSIEDEDLYTQMVDLLKQGIDPDTCNLLATLEISKRSN